MHFFAMVVVGVIGNVVTGQFNMSLDGQPIAHTDGVYNFLGLYVVGFGSAL